jgi:hypothetical protein
VTPSEGRTEARIGWINSGDHARHIQVSRPNRLRYLENRLGRASRLLRHFLEAVCDLSEGHRLYAPSPSFGLSLAGWHRRPLQRRPHPRQYQRPPPSLPVSKSSTPYPWVSPTCVKPWNSFVRASPPAITLLCAVEQHLVKKSRCLGPQSATARTHKPVPPVATRQPAVR